MEKKQAPERNKVMIGVGIAALVATAAAAAGSIFLYGTDAGKKKRKQIKGWMLKMKGDVMDKMELMKDWSEDSYASIIDTVAKKYEGAKKIDPIELAALVNDLKSHWKNIRRHTENLQKKPAKKKTTKSAKSTT